MVDLGRRAKPCGEDRPQASGPDFVAAAGRMQAVQRYTIEEVALGVGELVIDAEEADVLAVGILGDPLVDLANYRQRRPIVVTGKDGREDDLRVRRVAPARVEDRLDPASYVLGIDSFRRSA
jgi:hypothetical protein